LEFTLARADDLAEVSGRLRPLAIDEARSARHPLRVVLPVRGGTEVLAEALRLLEGSGVEVLDVGLRRPDLDDVFLTLTGHAAEEIRDGANGNGGGRAQGPPGCGL